jgi:hypothetical protein
MRARWVEAAAKTGEKAMFWMESAFFGAKKWAKWAVCSY